METDSGTTTSECIAKMMGNWKEREESQKKAKTKAKKEAQRRKRKQKKKETSSASSSLSMQEENQNENDEAPPLIGTQSFEWKKPPIVTSLPPKLLPEEPCPLALGLSEEEAIVEEVSFDEVIEAFQKLVLIEEPARNRAQLKEDELDYLREYLEDATIPLDRTMRAEWIESFIILNQSDILSREDLVLFLSEYSFTKF